MKNNIKLTDNLLDLIQGELLGDGHFQSTSVSARYTHSSKYESYLIWLKKELLKLGLDGINIRKSYNKEKTRYFFSLNSKRYKELKNLCLRWYLEDFCFCPHCEILFHEPTVNRDKWGNKRRCPICYNHYLFKKIVLKNLKLAPITIRQWYIGDGTFNKNDKIIKLYTRAFLKYNILTLISKLEELEIICWIDRRNDIIISKESTFKFLNYIGNCPSEIQDIYGYKWATRNELKNLRKYMERRVNASKTYKDRKWLIDRYWNQKKILEEIAMECNINLVTIFNWMKRYNIPRRNHQQKLHRIGKCNIKIYKDIYD